MRDKLLHYYEQELRFVRHMASEFAEKYPDIASRLTLEANRCEDPHVERLIETYAMMAARVQLKLDDDFSEISEALLGILYPHYLAPVPSMAIVQFELDPETGATAGGVQVPRHTVLRSPQVPPSRVRCRFRTSYPLKLWPLQVHSVDILPSNQIGSPVPAGVRSAVRIVLRAPEAVQLADLTIDALRFFIPGETGSVHPLYELLLKDPQGIVVAGAPPRLLGPDHVVPVGFGPDEGLLEYPPESFVGYRLLQEYFAFQEKFQFVELTGLDLARHADGARDLTLYVLLKDTAATHAMKLGPENLLLGCTPATNLFRHNADPIRVTHLQSEYEVVPDPRAPLAYEVYRVLGATGVRPGATDTKTFHPFYALRHGEQRAEDAAYFVASRRQSMRKDDAGTRVFVMLVDPDFNILRADAEPYGVETLVVDILATNRELPSRMHFGRPGGDFDVEGPSEIKRVRCVRNPTLPIAAPIAEGSRWRIISHLALSYLSLSGDHGIDPESDGARDAEESGGVEALREMLKLYDFADSPATRARINGLVGLQAKRVVRRIGRGGLAGFVRGIHVQLELDPHQFTGAGLFLFASVLERFLSMYASVNSFTQTSAIVRGREGTLKQWAPRLGRAHVL
jgi:type VI secretion system protein ImpG